MELPFKPVSTIGEFAKQIVSWNKDGWLFIKKSDELSLGTACYLQDWDGRDLSPEEQDELEDQIAESGYRSLFLWSQLNDIVENIRLQKPDYTDDELDRAINYYLRQDAFIDLRSTE
ncbi:MAG: hypothetical protein AAGB26_07780 [Planctomycetota bacterium]